MKFNDRFLSKIFGKQFSRMLHALTYFFMSYFNLLADTYNNYCKKNLSCTMA